MPITKSEFQNQDHSHLHWFDIDGEQTINGERQSIFASVMAWNNNDAMTQFFRKFPYGKINKINQIDVE